MKFLKELYYKNWESNRKDKLKLFENLTDFNLTLVNNEFSLSKLSSKTSVAPRFSFADRGIALKTMEENGNIILNSIELSFSVVFSYKSQAYELKFFSEIYDSTTEKGAYLDLYGLDFYPENHPAYQKLNVISCWVSNRILVSLKKEFGRHGDVLKLLGRQNYIELIGYLKFIQSHHPIG